MQLCPLEQCTEQGDRGARLVADRHSERLARPSLGRAGRDLELQWFQAGRFSGGFNRFHRRIDNGYASTFSSGMPQAYLVADQEPDFDQTGQHEDQDGQAEG